MFPFLNRFRSLVKWTGRRRSRPARRLRFARYHLILEYLESRSLPSTITWTGAASTLWSNSLNWNPHTVPGAADTAVFTSTSGNHTATVDQTFTVAAMTVDGNWGGTINVSDPLTITGNLSVASGTFGGAANITARGSIVLNGGSFGGTNVSLPGGIILNGGTLFDTGTLTLGGTSRWTGGTISIGFRDQLTQTGTLTLANPANNPVTLNGDGTLVNTGTIHQDGAADLNMQSSGINNLTTVLNQGTYDFQTDTGISSNSGGGTFNNQGILSKSAGRPNASSTISVLFNSSSEIDVNAGVLRLASNGGSLTGGTFNVATGATLDLTGGTNVGYTGSFTGSGGGTVSLSSGDLFVGAAGATFNFPAPLFQWSGGTITVPFEGQPLTNAGTITLANPANTPVTLNGDGTLVNAGTMEQDGATGLNMQSSGINNLTTLLNQGTYDFQTDTDIFSNSGGGMFNNQGILSKSAGRANSFSAISVLMNNSSEVDANAGNLKLAAGGGVLNGGTYNAAAGATLDLTGGATVTISGTLADSGAQGGTVVMSSGDLAVDPVNGATFAFDPGVFQWTGGTISVPFQQQPLTNVGDITLANTGLVTLNGDGTFINAGTMEQTGPADLNMQSSGINNLTTLLNQGVYSIQADSGISSNSGGGMFNNQGILSKDAGSGLSFSAISVLLNNSSEIDANVGNLKLASNGGVLNGGTYNAAAGATLDLTGGQNLTISGTLTDSGAKGGTVVLSSGDLAVDPVNGATFAFDPGVFQWTGGTISVPFQGAALTNTGDITLANNGLVTLNGDGTFINAGTIEQTGPGDLNMQSFGINNLTTFINQAGATYNIQADSGISSNSGGGTFINQGTLQKSSGSNTSTVSVVFNNSDTPGNPNSDLVLASSGTLNFPGGSFTQTAGAVNLAGGSVAGGTLLIQGGLLEGVGTVAANVDNFGVVSPGGDGAVGVLTINGNYTQEASGALDIDIGSATSFDQLVVTGTASLGGTLNVNLLNGFMPSHGENFAIMMFASHAGNFASITAGFSDTFSSDGHTMNLVAS